MAPVANLFPHATERVPALVRNALMRVMLVASCRLAAIFENAGGGPKMVVLISQELKRFGLL
jgi:hypothetical protein